MDNYDFEKIPLWSGDSSSFEILIDEYNGRIPATRIEHWNQFSDLLESDFFNQPQTQLIFRGHRRYDWDLMPTLARIPESGIIEKNLADNQLEHFKRAVRGRLSDNTLVLEEQEDELWSVGQHHGLMTPLLDWTYSPFVALFFSFHKEDSEEEKENPYRAIYVLNRSFVADDKLCPDIRMFEPKKDDHGRLVNQAGLFTFSPYGSTIENKLTDTIGADDFQDDALRNATEDEQSGILAKYICKIYIKNEDREACMRALRRMNVHHASLFPDLIGAAEYSNLLVAEEQQQYEIEKSAEKAEKLEKESTLSVNATKPLPQVEASLAVDEVSSIVILLSQHAGKQVEPGRVQFLAEHISKKISSLKVVDWYQREPSVAKIRSAIRIALRKYSYPSSVRDTVIDALIEKLLEAEGGGS